MRRSIISIDEYGDITIKTPYKKKEKVLFFIQKEELWLRKALARVKTRKKPNVPEEVELFGEIVQTTQTELLHYLQRLKILTPENINRAYDRFYNELAKKYLPKRVAYYEAKMGLKCKGVRYRKMKRRWGSCSKEGVITFNTNLLKRDKHFIDEVVVHELAHLVHFNHSKAFHQLVAEYI